MTKAPIGGITSHVNGQFYEGGQFIPDHGKHCGKGKNRVSRAEFDGLAAQFDSLGYDLVYREKFEDFAIAYQQDDRLFGRILFSAKSVKTLAAHLGMHPRNKNQ